MVMLVSILVIVIVGAGFVIAMLVAEIRRITLALDEAHTTSALITSYTNWPVIRNLCAAANTFVHQAQASEHQRLQQDRTVRHMLSNLTHDIKTPLTVASGYVQVLQADHDDPRLAKVMRNLTAVNDYLRYLMNYSLLQEKTQRLELTMVDLTKLVTDALLSNYDALVAKGLTVTPRLDAAVTLVTDRTVMNRVVQNMLGNWLKYADRDLVVTLKRVPDAVVLRFENHSSKALDDLDALAQRFATGDAARSDNSVGLGLNIVESLLKALGGTLRLSGDRWHFVATITLPTQHD